MSEIKIADVSLLNFCNFSCDYCIADSIKEKPMISENGSVKIVDPRYNSRGYKNPFNAKQAGVPFEDEAFNKWVEGKGHARGHFLDLNALLRFCKKHLNGWLITLSGGEPLLYPKIDEFITELTKTHSVVILTNASLISAHKALLDLPKDRLFFRVGFHPEQRTIDSFKNCIEIFKEHDANYVVNYILHPKHIQEGTYQDYIDLLNESDYKYEITRYEGQWMDERYSCHLPMRDWELEIIGDYSSYVSLIPSDAPGSRFLAITAGGDIYECHNRNRRMGSVYENWLKPIPVNSPSCFTSKNICPSIKANYDIHQTINRHQS